jgi:DNA-binding CsgD family transcriptional regulator
MITSDTPEAVVEHFRNAAFGLTAWSDALRVLGDALRSPFVQFAAVTRPGSLALNHLSGVSDDMLAGYFAARGHDPAVNPRTRGLLERAPWQCFTDMDLVGNDRDRWAIYDFFDQTDAANAALIRLRDRDDLMSCLAVIRPTRAGEHDRTERDLLRAVTPGVESAFHAAVALGSAQDQLVVDTAEALSRPVILLGADRHIVSMSPSAERMLVAGAPLCARAGRLIAADLGDDAGLDAAVRQASLVTAGARQGGRWTLRGPGCGSPLPIDLFPLPRRMTGPLSQAQVLLTLGSAASGVTADQTDLRRAYGLTGAEAAVARLLADGHDLRAIAARRGSSVQTVRSQLKTIFEKTGTHRQAELVILVQRLG